MKNLLISIALLPALHSCNKKIVLAPEQFIEPVPITFSPEKNNSELFPWGTRYSISKVSVQGAYNQLLQDIRKNPALKIVAEVDHSRNAKSIGLNLNFEKIVFFGNPSLGTALMQRNQLAGIDLPQKILFYQTDDKKNVILYNSVEYLNSRHDLNNDPALAKISNALSGLVSGVSKTPVMESAIQSVGKAAGIISKQSTRNFETTYDALRSAIAANPNLNIVAEVDHQKNAGSVNLTLRPTRLIIFGNAQLGTPLMQNTQSIGLDLPQKMLVWQDENGDVKISYNDIYFLQKRHALEGENMTLAKIAEALNQLSNAGAGL